LTQGLRIICEPLLCAVLVPWQCLTVLNLVQAARFLCRAGWIQGAHPALAPGIRRGDTPLWILPGNREKGLLAIKNRISGIGVLAMIPWGPLFFHPLLTGKGILTFSWTSGPGGGPAGFCVPLRSWDFGTPWPRALWGGDPMGQLRINHGTGRVTAHKGTGHKVLNHWVQFPKIGEQLGTLGFFCGTGNFPRLFLKLHGKYFAKTSWARQGKNVR